MLCIKIFITPMSTKILRISITSPLNTPSPIPTPGTGPVLPPPPPLFSYPPPSVTPVCVLQSVDQ